jgi:hypothetical protein
MFYTAAAENGNIVPCFPENAVKRVNDPASAPAAGCIQ